MSKVYKTWEMIKELSENPDKKFKSKDGIIVYNLGCGIYFDNDEGKRIEYAINIYDKWKEVKEPVTWQEAIQAWVEGKTIYCILQDNQDSYKYIYSGTGFRNNKICISRKEIVEGNWYIED